MTPVEFTVFMRKYQDMVYSTAVRLVANSAQAEDISQEVFLKAYERFHDLRVSPTAGGWLKTVATHLSLNHLQRYRRRWSFFSELRRSGDDEDSGTPDFPAPEADISLMDEAERRTWLEESLAALPDRQRIPLVLYHFEDMPYQEIASRLGVSLAKVKTDILRGRAALGRALMRNDAARETLPAPDRP